MFHFDDLIVVEAMEKSVVESVCRAVCLHSTCCNLLPIKHLIFYRLFLSHSLTRLLFPFTCGRLFKHREKVYLLFSPQPSIPHQKLPLLLLWNQFYNVWIGDGFLFAGALAPSVATRCVKLGGKVARKKKFDWLFPRVVIKCQRDGTKPKFHVVIRDLMMMKIALLFRIWMAFQKSQESEKGNCRNSEEIPWSIMMPLNTEIP